MLPDPSILRLEPCINGWNSERPEFEQIVREAGDVRFIVEVGSWLGQSALRFMDLCPNAIICTVDTWLGSQEHMRDGMMATVPHEFGYPIIYRQFVCNIAHSKHAARVFPLPQTALHGARLLKTMKMPVDLCYIDGDHEPGSPFLDCISYWPLVRSGGTIFGDDADNPAYPHLWEEVQQFAASVDHPIERISNFWRIKKR
jgi:predicted O-methyltransferase YrrM